MKPECELKEVIRKVFWPAVILTANTNYAEEAISDSIDSLESAELATDAFLTNVLKLAIQKSRSNIARQPLVRDLAQSTVPVELHACLRLPTLERHCFVLKLLLRLPDELSARLLGIDIDTLNETTCAAVYALAALAHTGTKNHSMELWPNHESGLSALAFS